MNNKIDPQIMDELLNTPEVKAACSGYDAGNFSLVQGHAGFHGNLQPVCQGK